MHSSLHLSFESSNLGANSVSNKDTDFATSRFETLTKKNNERSVTLLTRPHVLPKGPARREPLRNARRQDSEHLHRAEAAQTRP